MQIILLKDVEKLGLRGEVVADSVQFLDSRGDGEGGGGGGGSYLPPAESGGGADFPSSPADDDIPF